jgi:hypothetical protein
MQRPNDFRIYRANKSGNGHAVAFQFRFDNKDNKPLLFLQMAPQNAAKDANGNATFAWKDRSITVNLGVNDVGELLAVLHGRKTSVGLKGSLYHQTPKNSKTISFSQNENGQFYLGLSMKEGNSEAIRYSQTVSTGEASVLQVLLEQFVILLHGWDFSMKNATVTEYESPE